MRAASGSGGTALSRSAAGQERLIQICGRAGPPCPDLRPGGNALSRSAAGPHTARANCGYRGALCPSPSISSHRSIICRAKSSSFPVHP